MVVVVIAVVAMTVVTVVVTVPVSDSGDAVILLTSFTRSLWIVVATVVTAPVSMG